MKVRGALFAFAGVLLMAGMFISVHRGARGRALAEQIGELADRRSAAETRRADLRREVEQLRSRSRIVRSAERLGFRLPDEEELVILDLSGTRPVATGAGR